MSESECPVKNDEAPKGVSACPVPGVGSGASDQGSGMLDWLRGRSSTSARRENKEKTSVGAGGEVIYNPDANDEAFGQGPSAGQKTSLSTMRSLSRIPKGEFTPGHQLAGSDDKGTAKNWIYPSEQQYFNAMKRKGYNPKEDEVGPILAIHNVINERSWAEIYRWEQFRGNANPKLLRFMGKPKELSPKAKFLSSIGRAPPFDRHDWIIDRDGEEIRYVIDFYSIESRKSDPHVVESNLPVHVDVRPALDSFGAAVDRLLYPFRNS